MDSFKSTITNFVSNSKIPGELKDVVVSIGQSRIKVLRLIGEGAFSLVYQCEEITTKVEFALKHVRFTSSKVKNMAKAEVDTLSKFGSAGGEFVVSYHGHTISNSLGCLLLLEYCPVSLFSVMQKKQNTLSDQQIVKAFGQTCKAVNYMHNFTPPLINRDLKIDNLLISVTGEIRLCDFGSVTQEVMKPLSTWTHDERCIAEAKIQELTTSQYRSPEMLDLYLGYEIGPKADIWALGCILYFMCYYGYPFEDGSRLAILNGHVRRQGPRSSLIDETIMPLIGNILVSNPNVRPTASSLVLDMERFALSLGTKVEGRVFNESDMPASDKTVKKNRQDLLENVMAKAGNLIGSFKEVGSKLKIQTSGTRNQQPQPPKLQAKSEFHIPDNLPLKFFTDRLAIMGCPTLEAKKYKDTEQDRRAYVGHLAQFLNMQYGSCYVILNLVNSASYSIGLFKNRVVTYGMNLEIVPSLNDIMSVLKRTTKFLASDPKRIVVIQCTDGGYLSLYFACVLLVFTRAATDFKHTFEKVLFAHKPPRWSPCHPSFLRYANYIETISNNPKFVVRKSPLFLRSISMSPVILCNSDRTRFRPFCTISVNGNLVFSTADNIGQVREYNDEHHLVQIPIEISVSGDVRVNVYHISKVDAKFVQKRIFSVQFHTAFMDNSPNLSLHGADDLDIASKSLYKILGRTNVNLSFSPEVNVNLPISFDYGGISFDAVSPFVCFSNATSYNKFQSYNNEVGSLEVEDLDSLRSSGFKNVETGDYLKSSATSEPSPQSHTHSVELSVQGACLANEDDLLQFSERSSTHIFDPLELPEKLKAVKIGDSRQVSDFELLTGLGDHVSPCVGHDLIQVTFPSGGQDIGVGTNASASAASTLIGKGKVGPEDVSSSQKTGCEVDFMTFNDGSLSKTQSSDAIFNSCKTSPHSSDQKNVCSFDNISSSLINNANAMCGSQNAFQSPVSPALNTRHRQGAPLNPGFLWSQTPSSSTLSSGTFVPQTFTNQGDAAAKPASNQFFVPRQEFDLFGEILDQHGFETGSKQSVAQNQPKITMNEVKMRQDIALTQDPVRKKVKEWAEGTNKNLRILLSTLHTVLWFTDKWSPMSLSQLSEPEQVKKAYRKACLCVHPDKHINTPNERLAKAIFVVMKESWAAFEASGCKVYP